MAIGKEVAEANIHHDNNSKKRTTDKWRSVTLE